MKASIVVTGALLSATSYAASDYISSCGPEWMPVNNVRTNHDAIERVGYNTAVDSFCDKAAGQEVGAKLFLSMATRVWMNAGGDPKTTGINGYVYFEIHNKQNEKHIVDGAKCKEFLKNLSKDGKCYGGPGHDDTKGGTWQVGADAISYHALGKKKPPTFDALDKTIVLGNEIVELGDGGKGNTLSPFPTYSFNDVTPLACHRHNDYDRDTSLYSALSAGCVSVEADIWIKGDRLVVSHNDPGSGNGKGTLQDLYLNPLKSLIDDRKAVFPAQPKQALGLLIDFKNDADKSWDALVKALAPLRDAGYLSSVDGTTFKQGLVTVIASGAAIVDTNTNTPRPHPKALSTSTNPSRAIFADARIDKDLVNFNSTNAYYASAKFSDGAPGGLPLSDEAKRRVDAAHAKGFKIRYWDISSSSADWQTLVDAGIDRINVDDLNQVAAVKWNPNLL